jgi:hypothetical protein
MLLFSPLHPFSIFLSNHCSNILKIKYNLITFSPCFSDVKSPQWRIFFGKILALSRLNNLRVLVNQCNLNSKAWNDEKIPNKQYSPGRKIALTFKMIYESIRKSKIKNIWLNCYAGNWGYYFIQLWHSVSIVLWNFNPTLVLMRKKPSLPH